MGYALKFPKKKKNYRYLSYLQSHKKFLSALNHSSINPLLFGNLIVTSLTKAFFSFCHSLHNINPIHSADQMKEPSRASYLAGTTSHRRRERKKGKKRRIDAVLSLLCFMILFDFLMINHVYN